MKKDHLILMPFLAIILVSGAIILILRTSQTTVSPHSQGPMNAQPANMALRGQIDRLEDQLQGDKNNHDLLVSLGNSYYDLGDPEKSIEYYEKAMAIKPASPEVLVDCGAMYRKLGDPDKAIEMFEKAIAIDSSLPQAYFNLGAVLRMEKGDLMGAAEAWNRYLELDPNPDPELKNLLENEILKAITAE